MAIPQNFAVQEYQPLSVSATSAAVQFTSSNAAAAPDLYVVNDNNFAVDLAFGSTAPTAVVSASAAGLKQVYIPGNTSITIKKGAATYVAGIAESSSGIIKLHIGYGGVT